MEKGTETRAVENSQFKIAYLPVPKTASTSMKYAFYQINHKRYEGYSRIAIIRDPVTRIISAYNQRVMRERELSENCIDMDLTRALNVPANPTRGVFLCNLENTGCYHSQ